MELDEEEPATKVVRTETVSSSVGAATSESNTVIHDSPEPKIRSDQKSSSKNNTLKQSLAWNKSVGVLSQKKGLAGLVKINNKTATVNNDAKIKPGAAKLSSSSSSTMSDKQSTGLSLLGDYSDSDTSDND